MLCVADAPSCTGTPQVVSAVCELGHHLTEVALCSEHQAHCSICWDQFNLLVALVPVAEKNLGRNLLRG